MSHAAKVLRSQTEILEYLFVRNALATMLAQPFFRSLHCPVFWVGFRFIVNDSRGQLARNRIDHYFQKSDHRGELVGRKLIDQLVSVPLLVFHTVRYRPIVLPSSIISIVQASQGYESLLLVAQSIDRIQERRLPSGVIAEEDADERGKGEGH